jgi:hypothetical protein
MSTAIGDVAKCNKLKCENVSCDSIRTDELNCNDFNCNDFNCKSLQVLDSNSQHSISGNLTIDGTMIANTIEIKDEVIPDRLEATHSVIIKISGQRFKLLLASVEEPRR